MKFIFLVKIKEGCSAEDYIEAWKKGSEIIQKSEGARGTALYKKVDDSGSFIAIAEWESEEARKKAMQKLDEAGLEVQQVRHKHKDYGDMEALGYFEEVSRMEPAGH